jgi:hypothetical protein
MEPEIRTREESLLDGDYVVVRSRRAGVLFIEARIHDDVEEEVDTTKVLIL